jgi:hypothetical protein
LFLRDPPNSIEERYVRAKVLGTLQVLPEDQSKSSEYFEATKVDTVKLPDGTEATLRYMEPVWEKEVTTDPIGRASLTSAGQPTPSPLPRTTFPKAQLGGPSLLWSLCRKAPLLLRRGRPRRPIAIHPQSVEPQGTNLHKINKFTFCSFS